MNLNEIRFKAAQVEGDRACTGCIFSQEKSAVCKQACVIAAALGLPDCDDPGLNGRGYIYVLDDSDPRQIPLINNRGEVI